MMALGFQSFFFHMFWLGQVCMDWTGLWNQRARDEAYDTAIEYFDISSDPFHLNSPQSESTELC